MPTKSQMMTALLAIVAIAALNRNDKTRELLGS